MAGRDYIRCKSCDCKLVYDGDDNIRDDLDATYGTCDLICPSCLDALEIRLAKLEQAPAVEPAQRCNCCGYLVTDSEHKGCLRAAKQEPAQAVPGKCEPVAEVLWYEPMLHEPQTKKGHKIIDASLSWMEKAPLGTKLYTAPPAIDAETKRMVLELCRLIIDKAGPDSMITRAMAQKAEKISERLEAGE